MERNNRFKYISRRKLLEISGLGLGSLALNSLLRGENTTPFYDALQPAKTPLLGRATAVIQMVQNGGPSQMDLFDPKPELT